MSSRSKKCVLIGHSTTKKAYKLLSLDTRNVFFSRDVKFYENIFPFKMKTCDTADADGASEAYHLKFFDSQWSQSPNDDRRDSLVEYGSLSHFQDATDTITDIA